MTETPTILIVDDDIAVCDSIRTLLEAFGYRAKTYSSALHFLADEMPACGCLVTDMHMSEMNGLELQEVLHHRNIALPVIMISGRGDVALAVRAMKAGAIDFIEKPFDEETLLKSIRRALEIAQRKQSRFVEAKNARDALASLTPRERTVLDQLLKGNSNKVAAYELGISARTIEIHRAHIMDKMNARSLTDVVRIALVATEE